MWHCALVENLPTFLENSVPKMGQDPLAKNTVSPSIRLPSSAELLYKLEYFPVNYNQWFALSH